jgi:hypothetical protein
VRAPLFGFDLFRRIVRLMRMAAGLKRCISRSWNVSLVFNSMIYQYQLDINDVKTHIANSCNKVSCLNPSRIFGTLLFAIIFPLTPGRL